MESLADVLAALLEVPTLAEYPRRTVELADTLGRPTAERLLSPRVRSDIGRIATALALASFFTTKTLRRWRIQGTGPEYRDEAGISSHPLDLGVEIERTPEDHRPEHGPRAKTVDLATTKMSSLRIAHRAPASEDQSGEGVALGDRELLVAQPVLEHPQLGPTLPQRQAGVHQGSSGPDRLPVRRDEQLRCAVLAGARELPRVAGTSAEVEPSLAAVMGDCSLASVTRAERVDS